MQQGANVQKTKNTNSENQAPLNIEELQVLRIVHTIQEVALRGTAYK